MAAIIKGSQTYTENFFFSLTKLIKFIEKLIKVEVYEYGGENYPRGYFQKSLADCSFLSHTYRKI